MPKRPTNGPPHRGGRPASGAPPRPAAPPARRPSPSRPPPRTPRGVPAFSGVDEVELDIERLVDGGDGFGRVEGVPLFVARSAPGDRVRVRIVERRPGYGRGEIVEIVTPGPGRREPRCRHFADCGGCDLQHLDEPTQLREKSVATLETLRRLSGMAVPAPREIVAGAPFGYRLRTQVHLAATGERVAAGYYARGSRRLVPVDMCPVLVPTLERALLGLSGELTPPVPVRVDLAAGGDGEIAAAPPLAGLPGRELVRRVGDFDYRYDARCFFQGHAGLLDRFVAHVVGDARGELAFDLYGGVGLFALPLARRYRRVVLVEGDRLAARYARKNVQLAELAAVAVETRAVETWASVGLSSGADRVVVDPPRDGLPVALRRLLVGRAPARLTYVSCHAAALARDLKDLAVAFEIESIVLVDLFPQTGHMEAIVQLVQKRVS